MRNYKGKRKYKQMKPTTHRGECLECSWYIKENSTCRVKNPPQETKVEEDETCHKWEGVKKSLSHTEWKIQQQNKNEEEEYYTLGS